MKHHSKSKSLVHSLYKRIIMIYNYFKLHLSTMIKKQILNRQECLEQLKASGVNYHLVEHPPVHNMQEMQEKVKLNSAPFIKNLFYVDSKVKGFYYVLASNDTKIEKTFWRNHNINPNNVRFAKEADLKAVLQSVQGAVNPFSLQNDTEGAVKRVLIDDHLFKNENWAFHPMDNTATVELSREDFIKFLAQEKIKWEKVNLDVAHEEK